MASEAERMKLLLLVSLKIWPLNASVTIRTQRSVMLVVMPRAIRIIVVDIEVGALKGSIASFTDEALLVVATCQLSIRRTDRFAIYGFVTTCAFTITYRRPFSWWRPWDWRWGVYSRRDPNVSSMIGKGRDRRGEIVLRRRRWGEMLSSRDFSKRCRCRLHGPH